MKIESNNSIKTWADLLDFFTWNEKDRPKHLRVNYVRVHKDLARDILANNKNMIVNGTVKWFNVENIGMNVYQVALNDLKETILVK